jgi:EmrB/QacA subfamily drug resistance transporter
VQDEERRRRATLRALYVAGAAFTLQQLLVLPALPHLVRDLHTTQAWAVWVVTGFMLSSVVLTPLLGKLGDQHGKDRVLLIAMGIFLAGALGAFCAWSIWTLIAFRIVQGAGAAILPLSYSIVRDEVPAERVGTTIGTMAAVAGVGGVLAFVIGGPIIDTLGWRFLFATGALGIALAAVLVYVFVPASPIRTPSRLDLPGASLLALGLTAFLVALTEAPRRGWSSPAIVALFASSAVSLLAFWQVELRRSEPLVDPRTLRRRTVALTNLTTLGVGFGSLGAWVLIPLFVQNPRGLSPAVARAADYGFGSSASATALFLLPASFAAFVGGPLAGRMGRRFGPRWPLAIGLGLASAGAVLLALRHDHPWQIVVAVAVIGVGVPMSIASVSTLAVQAVPHEEAGVASGINTVMRLVGNVLGAQIGVTILAAHTIPGTDVPSEAGYVAAFGTVAAVGGLFALLALTIGTTPRSAERLEPIEASARP